MYFVRFLFLYNMANPIDIIITPTALQAIDKVVTELREMDRKMQESARLFVQQSAQMANALNSITPSNANATAQQNAALTAQIQAQAQALANLQQQYNTLNRQRQRGTQQTAEEAVNQGILNRNAREAAISNSQLAGAYGRLNAQHAMAARNLQNLIARGRLATQTQREYDREIRNAQRDFSVLNTRILAADRAVGRFNRNVGNYSGAITKGLKDLLSAFGLVGGLQLAANIAKDIFETTKEIQSMDMALKQVTQTQQLYSQSQMFLSRIAEAYGADIGKLTTQFTQFYVSAKDKISGNQIENIFESVTKAGATMGLSVQSQERAFMALNQMMSKGTIQAEELRGQLGEALPGALTIMAKALGVSEKKLGEMMKSGQLLAADVLPKFAKQLEITYGIENVERIETLTAAQGRYTNAWRDFVRGLDDDGNKISNFMKDIIGVGTDLLIGVSRLGESSAGTRNRILKTLQEQGYNETLMYYKKIQLADEQEAAKIDKSKFSAAQIKEEEEKQKALKSIREKELQDDRDYNYKKAQEETAEFNRLKNRNLILKALIPKKVPFLEDIDSFNKRTSNEEELKKNVKAIEEINNLLSKRQGQILAVNKLLDKGKKITQEDTELTKAQLKAIEDALKAKYDAAKKELELQALKQETILNGELESYDNQYKALEKFIDIKNQIIQLDYKEQVRLAKGNKDKIRAAEIDAEMASIKQMQDGFSKLKAIRRKQNDEYIAEIKDIEEFLKQYHEDQNIREEAAQEVREKVNEANKKLIDDQIERLKDLKDATKDYLSSFGDEFASNSGFEETFNMFFKKIEYINEKGEKVVGNMFQKMLAGADTSAKKFGVYFNAIAESAQEAFNFISQASAKNFDGEKNRLQQQYDIALTYAGDNKAAQEKLAEDLEKKKKEIAYREAKSKQKQALFNIAVDTAQAVVSAIAESPLTFGLPWSAVALALGAAQAAVVASQEIPQYWMGGTHDGGLMMVNDGSGPNYKETVVTPDGKIHKPQGKNVIMNAPAGTEIYTHEMWNEKLNEMLRGKGIDMAPASNNYSGITKTDMREAMIDAISEQPQYHTSFDEEGITTRFIKKGNATINISKRGNSTKLRF